MVCKGSAVTGHNADDESLPLCSQVSYARDGSAVVTLGDAATGLRSGSPVGPAISLDASPQPLGCWQLACNGTWRSVAAAIAPPGGGDGGDDAAVRLDPPSGGSGSGAGMSGGASGAAAGVRYAYADAPEGCNLYNSAGLPAVPFISSGF